MYDFDTMIDRNNTGAYKWDYRPEAVKRANAVPLSVADMELSIAPAIKEAMHRAADHGICGYTGVDDEYFNALSSWQKRRHDFEIKREWLCVTGGVVTALGIAVRAFTEKGDGIIVQPPVYYPFFNAILSNERVMLENTLIYKDGRYEMDFEGLERLASRDDAKLLIMSSPHNPVGRVWTSEELQKLGEICKKHGVIVLADEIHQDIILPGHRHTCFASLPGMADNCIVCTAVSKTFNLAGLSCSNILIPNEGLRERFEKVHARESSTGVPYFARAASIAAYTQCDDWVDEMIAYVNGNFEFMYDFFEKNLAPATCVRAEGTYLAWADMRCCGLDAEQLEKLVTEKAFLALDEGYVFGEAGKGFERWNIALPRKELERALVRLKNAIKG